MSTTQQTSTGNGARPLNEETIAAVQRRIGIPVTRSVRQHNEVSSTDSFRQFAQAYGDDNPLYSDPEYARASSWGTPIAPPLYPYSAGVMRKVEWTAEQQAELAGGDPLANIGQYMCGERWVFIQPIRAGDLLFRTQTLAAAELKASAFGGGTGALVSHRITWAGEDDQPYAMRYLDYWHADREKSRTSGKNRTVEFKDYTDEDLERIDAQYAAETIRGRTPRLVSDVAVGEQLGPIVNGPLSVNDIVVWHVGTGMGDFGAGALKVGYKNRKRVPKFYQKNDYGFWEPAQRAHWNEAWAKQLGHPRPYDYGIMRSNWMVHLLTNWMGDDAWIWTLSSSVRKFNYLGDVHLVSGVVSAVDPWANSVTVDVTAVNQRDETTCSGQAVIILPTAGGGAAAIPDYRPEDVPEAQGL